MEDRFPGRIDHPTGAVGHKAGPEIGQVGLAEVGRSPFALSASATRGDPAESDVIADGESGDTGAEFHHDTGALVPEDRRKIDHRVAGDTMPVAVTDARGLHLDQHLTLPGPGERERLDRQGSVHGPEDGGIDLHGVGV